LRQFIALGLCSDLQGGTEYEHRLTTYINASRDAGIEICYSDPGIGRLEPTHVPVSQKQVHQTTVKQLNMWSEAKHACLHGVYHDIDVVCAHPTFLWQIFRQEGLPFEKCKHYAVHGAQILKGLMRRTNQPKRVCKELLYKMMYGGKTETWLKLYGCTADQIPAEFVDLQNEVLSGADALLQRYPMYLDRARELHGDSYRNLPGVALSLCMQTVEKHVLVSMYRYFNAQRNLEVGALIHDGLHVKTCDDRTKAGTIPRAVLRSADLNFAFCILILPFEFCLLPFEFCILNFAFCLLNFAF
jgi:hypothetical protein